MMSTVSDEHIPSKNEDLKLTSEIKWAVIDKMAQLIEENYVQPDVAGQVGEMLRTNLDEDRYEGFGFAPDLAGALTRDLQAYDLHFQVGWRPQTDEAASATPEEETQPTRHERWLAYSKRHNFGFKRVEILAGNIGYLDLRFFANPTYGGTTATAAMAVLANTDAIIIDLRQNGGGEPGMVQLLCSYFFEPKPVLINSLYWRKSETTQQFWTLPYLPGMRLPTTPVYVLISPRTGSAAEEFAYNLQTQNRATLLGQKTVGAANPGDGFKLVHGFEMFISTGAAVNPITKTNWEGQGSLRRCR
jgi:hypothetical protein